MLRGSRLGWAFGACALLLALAACGDAGSSGGPQGQQSSSQTVAQGAGNDGALLGIAQAQQGAERWWRDHDQALVSRDGAALSRLDAEPQTLIDVELVRTATSLREAILAQPRQPTAVRVHVPASQSWPVPVLAVYDLPASGGGSPTHVAVLLVKLNPGAGLIAVEMASLSAPEPSFDTDPAGYVSMGSPAGALSAAYAQYMEDVVHATRAPSPEPFAPGKLTSDAASNDATLLHNAPGTSKGAFSSVDIDYTAIQALAPVFDLAGGAGGFTLIAAKRVETLHAPQGQLLSQDAQRKNYGVDLAPGSYPQISIGSVIVLAAQVPAGGGAAQVVGSGGGVFQEG